MALPSPDDYPDWKSYARALSAALEDSVRDPFYPVQIGGGTTSGGSAPFEITTPAGYRPVWWNVSDALLYMGNDAFDPPTAPDLFQIDTGSILDAAITTNKVRTDAINASKILDGAVGTLEMAALAVTTAKIATSNITSALIAGGAVGSAQLADLGVINAKIGNAAVQTAQIGDAAIVNAKLGSLAVATANIQDAAIISAKILDASVISAKILDGAIVTAKIADAAIVTAKIGDAQIVTAKIDDLAVNSAKMANLAVTSAKIGLLAVGNTHIQDAAITNAKIGNVIQSAAWDGTNGWRIDKTGAIEGTAITIRNADGSVAFGSGSAVTNFLGLSEMVFNGGAETGNTQGWTVFVANGTATLSAVTTPSISGRYCFKLEKGAAGNAAYVSNRMFPVAPGEKYLYKLWARGSSATPGAFYARVYYYNAAQVYLNYEDIVGDGPFFTANTFFSGIVTVPANAYFAEVAIFNWTNGPVSAFFDDVSLTKQLDLNQIAGTLPSSRTTGFGALAALNSLSYGGGFLTGFGVLAGQNAVNLTSQVSGALPLASTTGNLDIARTTGFGVLASQNVVNLGSQVSGALPLASTTGNLDIARTTGFGSLAAISLLNSGNINTFIAGAAIGSALIANGAIGTAAIDNAAITSAKIADAAILSAKIADAAITNAKISSLTVDKISGGTLGANIDVGTGLLTFNVGTSKLILGRGFGTSNQFFLWFGPSGATLNESNAIVYLKTNGDAYYGGSLTAGTLVNAQTATGLSPTLNTTLGPIGSNGGSRTVIVSYSLLHPEGQGGPDVCPVSSGTPTAQIKLYRGTSNLGVLIGTLNATGTYYCTPSSGGAEPAPGNEYEAIGGSLTYTDTSGGTSVSYFAEVVSRTNYSTPNEQALTIRVTEE